MRPNKRRKERVGESPWRVVPLKDNHPRSSLKGLGRYGGFAFTYAYIRQEGIEKMVQKTTKEKKSRLHFERTPWGGIKGQ